MIENSHLRKIIGREEFDYQSLMSALSSLKAPHMKIRELLKKQVIIRVKKGLYVFGPQYAQEPYSRELLANLIYGPSYLSFESALASHGLIPEVAVEVTSVTPKRNRQFSTPVGRFSYRYLHPERYLLGVFRKPIRTNEFVFMATVEKALVDYLSLRVKKWDSRSDDFSELLYDDLRIDRDLLLSKFRKREFQKISRQYPDVSIVRLFTEFVGAGL